MSGTRIVLEGSGKFNYGACDLRGEWKRWKRDFTSWMIGAELDTKKDSVKANLLLTLLGSEGQDIFETFEFSEEQPKLATVLEQFDSHFAGLSNVTMARFRFFSLTQCDMSMMDFLTGLKSLANDCDFGDLRDSLVKDMIVIHCSSEKLRERLLKEPSLELSKAVEIARIGDDAERNVDTISRDADSRGAAAMMAGKRADKGGGSGTPFRRSFDGDCFQCGEYGHMVRYCPQRKDDIRDQNRKRETSYSMGDFDDDRKPRAGYAASYALGASLQGRTRGRWFVDSGASNHTTWNRESFDWYEPYRRPCTVTLGDGTVVQVYGQCDVKLRVRAAVGTALVTIRQVQFVPKLQMSLLSIPATTALGNEVICKRQICAVSCGSLRLQCPVNEHGLYEVPILHDDEGDQGRFRKKDGCPTPGGVMMKSEHHGRFIGRDYETRTQHEDYRLPESRNQTGGPLGYQDSPDTRTKTGGQGYPGASIRNGSKAGGQGYPGASTRNGSKAGGQGYAGASSRKGGQ